MKHTKTAYYRAAREARNDLSFFMMETRVQMLQEALTWEQGYAVLREHMRGIEARLTAVIGEETGS